MRSLRWLMMLCWLGLCVAGVQGQPLAQYTFNDGSAADVMGNGYDGVLLGSAAIVVDSERGQVLQINESGMQLDGPFAITTSFTLSAWIKLDQPRTGRFYFGGPWQFRTDNEGPPEHHWIEVRYPGGNFLNKIDTRSSASPNGQLDGQWHHLVLILPEDGAFQGYFDGVLAPFRNANPVRQHDFEGAVGPIFIGSQDANGGNAIKGYMDDVRIYNYAVAEEDIPGLMEEGLGADYASNPNPASGDTYIPRDVVLSWRASEQAETHNVYLGDTFVDVNNAGPESPLLVGPGITEARLPLAGLTYGKLYHWRVDEVAAGTVFKGEVWNFRIEPEGYPLIPVSAEASSSLTGIFGPQKTIDGSGLDGDHHSASNLDMWASQIGAPAPASLEYRFDQVYMLHGVEIWNANQYGEADVGIGVKDMTIETSTDGTTWRTLGDYVVPQGPGQPGYGPNPLINFNGILAKYVRLVLKSNWKGALEQYSLSEVRFSTIPVLARNPQPESGATGVDPAVLLQWTAGRLAAEHQVRLGSDINDLPLSDRVTVSQFDTGPLDLQLGQTYYWRIDEVNEAKVPTTHEGNAWNFSIPAFLVVDDMESYMAINPGDENEDEAIWSIWVDGYGIEGNGAVVGGDSGYPETGEVHSGSKSMGFYFDNTTAPLSEVTRTFDDPCDWSRAGIKTLVVHFFEDPANTGGQFYIKVNGKQVDYQPAPDVAVPLEWSEWKQMNIDLTALGIDLTQVKSLTLGVQGANAQGIIFVDDIRLYKDAPAVPWIQNLIEAESGTVTAPMFVYEGDILASEGKFIGTEEELGDSTNAPPAEGVASYSLTVPGGVYRLACRVITYGGSNTLWVRIADAVTNTANHSSGWVLFDMGLDENWHWETVNSRSDGGALVEFTLPAGTHTLEVAYREDGLLIDAIAVISLTE
ncbi:LamG-like jellyroll fold domain-containing protein [Planctomycetota bacterium]